MERSAVEAANAGTVGLFYVRVSGLAAAEAFRACQAQSCLSLRLVHTGRTCCSPQEHVRQSLPAVLAAAHGLHQTAAAAQDGAYAAGHSRDFAASLRRELPASLHRMESTLRDASWAASDVSRRHKEAQQAGSAGSSLGGLLTVPPRLRALWAGGSPGRGSRGDAAEASGGDCMYGPDAYP